MSSQVSVFSSTVGTDVTSIFLIATSGIASRPNASCSANGDFKVVVGSANGLTTINLMAVPEPSTGQGVVVIGQYAYDLAGQWYEVALTPTGASSSVANTTVKSFSQPVESGRPKEFMRFKATRP
jgi:hypothetical protein